MEDHDMEDYEMDSQGLGDDFDDLLFAESLSLLFSKRERDEPITPDNYEARLRTKLLEAHDDQEASRDEDHRARIREEELEYDNQRQELERAATEKQQTAAKRRDVELKDLSRDIEHAFPALREEITEQEALQAKELAVIEDDISCLNQAEEEAACEQTSANERAQGELRAHHHLRMEAEAATHVKLDEMKAEILAADQKRFDEQIAMKQGEFDKKVAQAKDLHDASSEQDQLYDERKAQMEERVTAELKKTADAEMMALRSERVRSLQQVQRRYRIEELARRKAQHEARFEAVEDHADTDARSRGD